MLNFLVKVVFIYPACTLPDFYKASTVPFREQAVYLSLFINAFQRLEKIIKVILTPKLQF